MNVKLIWITPEPESLIAYCARVSSPNQENPDFEGLLKYCMRNQHWSVFEMASMCLEIETSRAISAQILRHRSFSFQEFSQRYATATEFETYEARRQDTKNRQNSIDDMHQLDKEWFQHAQTVIKDYCLTAYKTAIEKGIAKEQARFLLPMSTKTKLYMAGTIRSWIHYINLRCKAGTQKEHMDIAKECSRIFCEVMPTIGPLLPYANT